MKNILSSLNESEKKRILEMHYKASGRHYLNEAVTADYNVIKTSMDATYGETMKKYLMSTVTLQGQDESGKPTQIKFNPTNPLGTIKKYNKIAGTNYDFDVLDPIYSCVDSVFLQRSDSVFEYQKAYASSIGATEQTAASVARSTWETELKKIGAAGCKAISDLSKGLPNPLVPQEKKPLPAPKPVAATATKAKTPDQIAKEQFQSKMFNAISKYGNSDYFDMGELSAEGASTPQNPVLHITLKNSASQNFVKVGTKNNEIYYCKTGWEGPNPFENNIKLEYLPNNYAMYKTDAGKTPAQIAQAFVTNVCAAVGFPQK